MAGNRPGHRPAFGKGSDGPHRHVRLQLPRVAGHLLSQGLPDRADAALLRGAVLTVEINNTFYRMPTAKAIAGWAGHVRRASSSALKAPQRITHFARLRDIAKPVRALLDTAGGLGAKLGPLLFQLPPNFQEGLPAVWAPASRWCPVRPRGVRVPPPHLVRPTRCTAPGRDRNAALCVADTEDRRHAGSVATADWGYLRLRDPATSRRSCAVGGDRARVE